MRSLAEYVRRFALASQRPVIRDHGYQQLPRQQQMARDENPPFARGQTMPFFSDDAGATIDSAGGAYLEGKEWMFEDINVNAASNNYQTTRSGKPVHCRCVRNKSGGALLGGRMAKYKLDGATEDIYGGQVSGYADTVGQVGGTIDEYLPAAGVPDNYLFWLVIEGPTTWTTAGAGDTNISLGAGVIPSTNGTVIDQDVTVAAGAATFNQIQGCFGRAAEAVNATATAFRGLQRRMI